MSDHYDIAIVGAGMAGASIAWFLSTLTGGSTKTVVLEAEQIPGYHTTGRSAAFWVPAYGGPGVRPLTIATRGFFDAPPQNFAESPLLHSRGALHLAPPGDEFSLARLTEEFATAAISAEFLDGAKLRERFPMLRPAWATAGLFETEAYDIDVAALHQGFLKGALRSGAVLRCGARVEALARERDGWRITTTEGDFVTGMVVNAAGAWGDTLAQMAGIRPLGLTPLRRTMVVLTTDPPPPSNLPVIFDAAGSFYFKPDAGRIWLSPHDEIPDVARDVVAEEMDIAVAVDRFEAATTMRVVKIERSWAGLRTFAPDRLPVYGFDPDVAGFFWCVGQGGFGIQTAPAAGELAARLLLGLPPTAVDPVVYAPTRFG